MPKVILGTQNNKALDDAYRHMLNHALVDIPARKLCPLLGISNSCLYKRKKAPEHATIRELRVLSRLGKLSDEQLLLIIKGGQA